MKPLTTRRPPSAATAEVLVIPYRRHHRVRCCREPRRGCEVVVGDPRNRRRSLHRPIVSSEPADTITSTMKAIATCRAVSSGYDDDGDDEDRDQRRLIQLATSNEPASCQNMKYLELLPSHG